MKHKTTLMDVMAILSFILTVSIITTWFVQCGSRDVEVGYEKPKKGGGDNPAVYTFADFDKYCFNCHNATAPKIPLDEAGFKSSKGVKARIADGTMPPSKGDFDKAAALKYLD